MSHGGEAESTGTVGVVVRYSRLRLFLLLFAVALLALPATASAEHGTNPAEMSPNMFHLANRMPSRPSNNSDLAFWRAGDLVGPYNHLAAAGNYDGFRILDVSKPANPVLLTDFRCRGPQGDLSFYQANNRLLLIQSIDRPLTTEDCATAQDTPVAVTPQGPRFVPGFEGLRIFDVSNPTAPVHIGSAATACGSHTHTTIPDRDDQRAVIYVSSYPTGPHQSPPGFESPGPRCQQPHAKISIVEVHDRDPSNPVVREHPLHADTKPFLGTAAQGGTGVVGCHDITVLTEATQGPESDPRPRRQTAAAACLEEGQLWDISDPANPDTLGRHSHIYNPLITPANPVLGGLFHSASFTWDGEVILFTDEWQGGGAHGCDGPEDTRGNIWFYKAVPPGTPNVPLYGRYMIPRPQPANEICTLHNGNVIPTNDGYFGLTAAYQGGTSVFDFTGVQNNPEIPSPGHGESFATIPPLVGREVAYADMQSADGRTRDDVWSSYWWNDFIWVNGGLLGLPGDLNQQRGFDVFKILLPPGKGLGDDVRPNDRFSQQYRARKTRYLNPQTQEDFQGTGWGQGDQNP